MTCVMLTWTLSFLIGTKCSHVKDCRDLAKELRGHGHGQQLGQVARDFGANAGNVQGDDEGK